MPSIKLTVAAIARLRAPDPSGKQRLFWDTELRGFGLLVSGVTTATTYIVQRTLASGRTRRVTVAASPSGCFRSIHWLERGQARHLQPPR